MKKKADPNITESTNGKGNGLIALAFNGQGQLLAQSRPEGGQVAFDIDPEELRYAQAFILPEPPFSMEHITLEEARRLRAYRPPIRLDANHRIGLSPIPDSLRDIWRWTRCCASGTVSKRFTIDGLEREVGICNAIVHICEVDPIRIVLPTIPDHIIKRLRDYLLERIPLPDPIPPIEQIPEIPRPIPFGGPAFKPISGNAAETLTIDIPQSLRQELQLSGLARSRQLFLDNIELIKPYICLLPRLWPYFYRCDEITTVRTDHNGRFEACFFRQTSGDQPDLYFWVEYEIDGVPTTVYRPYLPCNTYWNYDCGTEVEIEISDPRVAISCFRPLEGQIAWIKRIGAGAAINGIEQDFSASISVQGENFRTVGLSSVNTGGLSGALSNQKVRPFALNFPIVIQFGSGFPSNNVSHYRWSYRKTHNDKLGLASVTEREWKPLDSESLSKPYTVEVVRPDGTTVFQTRQYPLGPFEAGDIQAYRIPPVSPKGSAVSGGDDTAEWDQDTRTVAIDSASLLGDGLYEFKLEFFNGDGERQDVPDTVYQINDPATGGSTPVSSELLLPATEDGLQPFRMKVRIDNQRCRAEVFNVEVDNDFSTTECGFVDYANRATSQVTLSFEASHPNNFATFSFNVARGNSRDSLSDAGAGGMVIGNTGGYTRNVASIFEKEVPVSYLLGSCPDKAAFAERLHVQGLHTNGSEVLNTFNAGDLDAFALEPEK